MSNLTLKLSCEGERDFTLHVDCQLPDSGVSAIYGPSGSGKSTLLDCIAGLRKPTAASTITFRGQPWARSQTYAPPWERNIGYVFQDARLFPHLTVTENLEFAAKYTQRHDGPTLDTIAQWLDLQPLLSRMPSTLSGGQKQRVAVGRALLSAPQLLLLDEPLANLDKNSSAQCLRYLQRLTQELDLPMLYVSHDIEEISQLADHIVLLEQGRVVDQGSLLQLSSKLDSHLSQEEQAAAILTGTITAHDREFDLTELKVDGHTLQVNRLDEAPGKPRRLRIPARDISICRSRPLDTSILNVLPVTICEIKPCSQARIMLRLDLGSQYLLARITRKSAVALNLQTGDQVFAQIKSTALLTEASDSP